MSYYLVNIAVKWANGDLEGFSATALTEAEARKRATDEAYRKASHFPGNSGFNVLTSAQYRDLSDAEQDELQRDWRS